MLKSSTSARAQSLVTVAECCHALLNIVAEFLVQGPADFSRVVTTSRSLAVALRPFTEPLWEDMYRRRWPVFHRSLRQGVTRWSLVYQDTLEGRDFVLEVYERERKLGFSMSAMPARVHFDWKSGCYVATYMSVSIIPPEVIPCFDEHRLRCPRGFPKESAGPYAVFTGIEDLLVGQSVELQWKMQFGSPFGWWFCVLESIRHDGDTAVAALTFNHFPQFSRWFRLHVRFGDSQVRPCEMGGYSGGLRGVSALEHQEWMRFFPEQPVIL